jgi:hypothetical protein
LLHHPRLPRKNPINIQAAGILIFLSIQDYYHVTYYTFLAVKNDDAEYLPMRIDITFNEIPCHAI